MHQQTGRLLMTSSLAAMLLGSLAALPARAQTAPDTGVAGEEIVVTGARKRSEDIQTVPIAITALTAKDLADRNITSLTDLSNVTPGIAITSVSGGNIQNIYIRGLAPANTANDLNVDGNVGIFIDGIYQTSRNTTDIISVLDVSQIEFAKGPQSALFGRSTFAGAMSIATGKPSQKLEGGVTGTVGQNDDYRLRGTIAGPISDTLSARIAAGYATYDGYGKNTAAPDDNLGGTEKYAVTASLEYAPTTNFTARLSGFVTHSESESSPYSLQPISGNNCGNVNAATGQSTLYCGTLQASRTSSISDDLPNTVAKARQLSLNMDWDLGGVSFASVTGYAAAENHTATDYDGTSDGVLMGVCQGGTGCLTNGAYTRLVRVNLASSERSRVRTFSQELRLQSAKGSPFQWLVGGNYFMSKIPLAASGIATTVSGTALTANERLVQVNQFATPAATGVGAYDYTANAFVTTSADRTLFASYSDSSTRTISAFGAVGYAFGKLRVNAEGRYNIDRKQAQVFSISNPTTSPGFLSPIDDTNDPATGTFPNAGTAFSRTFKAFTPRFTVDYAATRDIFLYASAAKGVRSGGFNTANAVSTTGILQDEVSYDQESNWTYEAGFKTHLFNQILMLNASVFHVDWSNAQVSAFTQNPTAQNPVRIVRNVGGIKTTGAELQAEVRATDMFGFGGSVTYSDPKFNDGAYDSSFIAQCVTAASTAAPGCSVITITQANGTQRVVPSLGGLRTQRSIQLQWNLHTTANVPITENWTLTGRVDVSHTGPSYNNLINTSEFGERTLTNLRVGVETARYGVFLWANNVFDKAYVSNSFNQPRAGYPTVFSVAERYLGETRRVGLTANAKF